MEPQTKTTLIGLIVLLFAIVAPPAIPSAMAQAHSQDRIVGYKSPIPDIEPTPTLAKEYDGLKPGRGREEVYFAFSPCLKTGWIKRQSLASDQWLLEVNKMAENCGIAPLASPETEVMVDYLATYYGKR